MPSVKKRIQVRVTDEVDQALQEFKAISGVAPASFIAQMVNDSLPMIKALTESLKAAKTDTNSGVDILRGMLHSAHEEINTVESDLDKETEDMLRKARSDD